MASSGNFPLWSPLIKGATNLSLGNTRFDGTTNSRSAVLPFTVPTGTKFYVECLVKQMTNYNITFGLVGVDQAIDTYLESQSTVNGMIFHGYNAGEWRTQALVNGSRQGFSGDVGMTATRVLGMTINTVDNEIKMYLDNTLIGNGTISISATQEYRIFCSFTGGAQSGVHMNINCGHDSTGAGEFTSGGGNADENGFGDFQNSPPSGFLALCSANLPMNTNQDPAEDTPPNNYFEAVTYSGNGSTQSISSLNFQPDMVWIKNRDQSDAWCVQDDINGVGKTKQMNSASAYASESNCITSFNSDGFSLGNNHKVNASGENYVAYCFKESQEAGLDMFSYTGVGDGTAPFSHNLGETPKMVWIFLVSGSATDTMVYMDVPDMGYSYGIFPSLSNARQATSYVAATSSSSITVGSSANATGRGYFAMLWAEREGFSKYGQYTGNGNTDGPFIYTGFRPRFLWIKNINSASNWQARDTARKTFNVHDTTLNFDSTTTETTNSNHNMDILSNGFKLRTTLADYNENGSEFIFAAWADVPFKYNNTF